MGKYTEVEYFINKNFFLYSLMKEIGFSVYTFFFFLSWVCQNLSIALQLPDTYLVQIPVSGNLVYLPYSEFFTQLYDTVEILEKLKLLCKSQMALYEFFSRGPFDIIFSSGICSLKLCLYILISGLFCGSASLNFFFCQGTKLD